MFCFIFEFDFSPYFLISGLQLARSDSFPNPDAILNSAYDSVLSVPSNLHYFSFVAVPNFIFTGIPHFFLESIPYFFTETIPYVFWTGFGYLKNISNINFFGAVSDLVSGFYNGFKYYVTLSAETVFNFFVKWISVGYTLSYKYMVLFYAYFCTLAYDLISSVFNWISYLGTSLVDLIFAVGNFLRYGATTTWNLFQSTSIAIAVNLYAFAEYLYGLLTSAVLYAADGGYYAYEIVSENLINSVKWVYDGVAQGADSVYSGITGFFEEEKINEVKEEVNASVVADQKTA